MNQANQHPFMRPWADQVGPLVMEKLDWSTGPFQFEDYEQTNYQFHWRMSDLLNPLANWHHNPRAGLPAWLTIAAQK